MTEIPSELINKIENFNPPYARFIREEQLASRALTYCSNVLPGPLQTFRTARAMTKFFRPGQSEDIIETVVEARMSRAERLLGSRTLSSYFIPEHILRLKEARNPAQINYLVSISDHPAVDLRIIPDEELHRAEGAPTLLEFNDKDPIVYVENFTTTRDKIIEDQHTVGKFQEVFSELSQKSLNKTDSSDYLREFRAD